MEHGRPLSEIIIIMIIILSKSYLNVAPFPVNLDAPKNKSRDKKQFIVSQNHE